MEILYLEEQKIAVVSREEKMIVDGQSALDLAMSVKYQTDAEKIVLNKEAFVEESFMLSTGLAGI